MRVTFNCMMNCGGGDGSDWDCDIEITEEEFARLKKAKESGKEFGECEEVRDIYMRLFDIADESATEDLLDYDCDFQEEYEENENIKASHLYSISVEYPYQV